MKLMTLGYDAISVEQINEMHIEYKDGINVLTGNLRWISLEMKAIFKMEWNWSSITWKEKKTQRLNDLIN